MTYSSKQGGKNVVVKAVKHSDKIEKDWDAYMKYVDYLAEKISVASFVEPGIKHSENRSKLVSVTENPPGVCPECVYGYQWSWITNEDIVREIGGYVANMRLVSQKFEKTHEEYYKKFPSWE